MSPICPLSNIISWWSQWSAVTRYIALCEAETSSLGVGCRSAAQSINVWWMDVLHNPQLNWEVIFIWFDIPYLTPASLCVYYVPVSCMHMCKATFMSVCVARLHELQGRGKKQSARLQLEMELPVVYLNAGHIYAQRGSPFCLLITAAVGRCTVCTGSGGAMRMCSCCMEWTLCLFACCVRCVCYWPVCIVHAALF